MVTAPRTLPPPRRGRRAPAPQTRRWAACLAASAAVHAALVFVLAWALGPVTPRGIRRVRGPMPRVVFELVAAASSVPWSESVEPPAPVDPLDPSIEPEVVERDPEPEAPADEPAPPGPSLRPLLEPDARLAELPVRFERPLAGALAQAEPPPPREVPILEPPPDPGVEERSEEPAPAGAEGEEDPVLEHAPPPAYPRAALRLGLAGEVLLRLRVSAEGRVLGASVERSSGHAMLDEAALDVARTWRFRPGRRGGEAVEREVLAPVTFRLP